MKNLISNLFLSFATLFLLSCGGDDGGSPSINFKNQELQGAINSNPWQYASGTVEPSAFDAGKLSIDMTAESIDEPCDAFLFGTLRVFFSVTNEVGLYEFSLFFDDPDNSQTITLYDPDGSLNVIVTEGALEILTITSSEVTGRIDARYDDDNFVNGSFTVAFCE